MSARSGSRGFSLVEMMVAVALLAAVIAGVSGLLIQQSLTYAKQDRGRSLEENGRLALLDLARAVRLAGFGITPLAAFDMDRYACTTPGTSSTCNGGGRDRNDAPDELVVSWRDPAFARSVTAIAGSSSPWTLTLNNGLTQPLIAGRILQLVCTGASNTSYVALNAAAASGATTLTVRAVQNSDGYYPSAGPTDPCFATSVVVLVERHRYFIANDTDNVPSLYRERGRGGNELLYRGIEDLQIAYTIGAPPAGSAFAAGGTSAVTAPESCSGTLGWTFGNCLTGSGASLAGVMETPRPGDQAPDWINDPYDSAKRYTGHPANIRSVTLTVVARGTVAAPDKSGDAVPTVGNRPGRAWNATLGRYMPPDAFQRAVFTVTEQTPNLVTRAQFQPPVVAGADLNVGGG